MEANAQWAVRGALLAGLAWAATGVAALAFPGPDPGPFGSASYYVIEGGHAIAETGMVFALAGIWGALRSDATKVAQSCYVVAVAATGLLAVITYLSALLPAVGVDLEAMDDTAPSVLFMVSLLGTLVGFVGLGVATIRAQAWPRLLGVLLILHPLLLAVLLGVYPMGMVIGLLWLAVAMLMSRRGRSPSQRAAT